MQELIDHDPRFIHHVHPSFWLVRNRTHKNQLYAKYLQMKKFWIVCNKSGTWYIFSWHRWATTKLATTTLPKHIKLKTYFLNVKTPTGESPHTPPLSMQLILISITKSSNINNNIIGFPAANHKLEKENTVVLIKRWMVYGTGHNFDPNWYRIPHYM